MDEPDHTQWNYKPGYLDKCQCKNCQGKPTNSGRGDRSIPIEPLRKKAAERIEQLGISYAEVCRRLGWDKHETHRLKSRLGLVLYKTKGRYLLQHSITERMAKNICEAIHLDPVDIGL